MIELEFPRQFLASKKHLLEIGAKHERSPMMEDDATALRGFNKGPDDASRDAKLILIGFASIMDGVSWRLGTREYPRTVIKLNQIIIRVTASDFLTLVTCYMCSRAYYVLHTHMLKVVQVPFADKSFT